MIPDALAVSRRPYAYSDTPKLVPRKMHQTENFVDHLILWHNMGETEQEELKGAYRREKDPRVVEHMITPPTHL